MHRVYKWQKVRQLGWGRVVGIRGGKPEVKAYGFMYFLTYHVASGDNELLILLSPSRQT